ncbi:MAG: deoxyribose-phosphate aldolase [Treponema sp.]|nr:deoxyribose-phosphate aldolase [Bacteroidales bacterium]MBQ3981755.1 deoxyribose-phosphate aldolase [Treponema sp.]MBQ7468496.1 deoxyribose-phosphate aldolase [Bacteroidales bacterium]MBQ8462194.1 deoxyribose-phosphate aldolase [Bacteroidales bacterium]MDT3361675.1 deoxyribose-phosphate aldolase [Bacteroidota bacterium]
MAELFKKYGYAPDKEAIDANLQTLSSKLEEIASKEVFLTCFSAMDLTTLKTNDTCEGVEKLVNKVNAFKKAYPSYPLPASVCVYSNFAKVVSTTRQTPELHTTCVSACFPSSQSFLPVKLLECEMAVKDGADEIDIVLPLSKFLAGKFDAVREELRAVRKTVDEAGAGRKITLKVILETGLLTPEQIAEASFISMEEGADFIKTSTGKIEVNATPAAAYVMCECIKAFNKATGKKVGFKPAGGVSTAMEAVCYYSIVKAILGDEWLNKDLFRLGVSRLANNLLSAIEGKTIVAF